MSSSTAANRMNLAALQRVDPAVTEIVDNASQVALYKFASATNGWEKTEIEGALFVFAWSKTPSHGFIVMNRLNTTNLLELITQEVEFQTQSPFLLYRSGSGIYCIWFYDTKECERVGKLCRRLTRESKMSSSKSKNRQRCASESDSLHKFPLAAPAASQNGAPKDIVALLSKAKDQYNMKKAEASSNGQKQHRNGTRGRGSRTFVSSTMANSVHSEAANNGHDANISSPPNVLHKPTPLRTTSNGVVPTATAEAPSTPLSVESLFAAVGQKTPVASGPEDAKEALLRALLSNPDNRVEHVERIQRKEADANGDVLCEQPRLRAASCQANITAWEASDDLRHKLNLCSAPSSAENSVLPPVVTPAMLEMGLGNAERRSSPTTASFGDTLSGREPFKAPAASDLPLLTPMAFTKPLGQPAAMPSLPFGPASFATPGMFMNGDVVAKNRESVNALTKDQLKDALVHMLQTDDSFLVKLHEAYVGSLKSRFNLNTRTGNGSSTGSLL